MNAPWFEDFFVGADFSDVPAVTITEGHAAVYQAIFADRSRLPLSQPLSEQITGRPAIVNATLVSNIAIGQSTVPSQRVIGNLFYRGLMFAQSVYVGDTLTTQTKVVALRQNKIQEGRPASGMAVLEIRVENQRDETVMNFWRCPMIPCQDAKADTGHNDDFDAIGKDITESMLQGALPKWNYQEYVDQTQGRHARDYSIGERIMVEGRDTVTSAPEFVRMTLNLAMTHTDAARSVYGKRLVYGGHTISIAASLLSRAIPNLMSVLAWYQCDHVAPVFEDDILRAEVIINNVQMIEAAAILDISVEVYADRGAEAPEPGADVKVLDWHLAGLMACG